VYATLRRLGEAIRTLRTEHGVSQEELGLRTGVHRNYIGGLERGERQPTVVTVAKLAAALGVQPSELLERAERHPPGVQTFRRRGRP
jgi:transcriptional regulator with XRE-family HTH domain